MIAPVNEKLLEERLVALEGARPWSPRVVSRLEAVIRSGSDEALFRINPVNFAAEKSLAETEAIDLFLHAAAVGLVEMSWMLLCPTCSCVVESFGAMNKLHDHYHCHLCRTDIEAKLDDYIAVTFTVSEQIRRSKFHSSDDLTPSEYCFSRVFSREGRLPDGEPFSEMWGRNTRAVGYLTPGAASRFDVDAKPGLLIGWDTQRDNGFGFAVDPSAPKSGIVHIRFNEHTCDPSAGAVAPGKVVIEIANATQNRVLFGITNLPPDYDLQHPPLNFGSVLSGGRLLTTQTFRNLFRSQVIEATEGIGVRDVALLFTDLKGSTELYDRIGDLNAYSHVQRHFERIMDVTIRNRGAVIKTIGDAVMAAFPKSADAVAAAIEMRHEIEQFNETRSNRDFILKIGVHHGASIAVTLNKSLDYFGQTVNIASRVQHLAAGDEICLTGDVYGSPGVATLLAPFVVKTDRARLKGVEQELAVYRVQGGAPG
jgi:class 3 adenylate cyclase